MRNRKTSEMTMMAMFIAIIVAMSMIPFLGYIQIGPVAIVTIHIPVIIGTIYGGRKYGLVLGTAFGVFSLIVAYVRPGVADVVFQNPFISILPRIIFGLLTWYIYKGLRALISNEPVVIGLTFGLATLTHTIVVLSSLVFFQDSIEEFFGPLFQFIAAVMALNGPIEIILAIMIGTPIVRRLKASNEFTMK
jgi:uncharacterized membrane protein